MKEQLEKLGFSKHEAEIYLALLELKQTGAGGLIKKTGLHRNIVYETLDKLINRRLVTKVVKKKVAHFVLGNPERILDEQRTNLEIATELVPALVQQAQIKQEIVVFEGIEGFRTFSMSMINAMRTGSTMYVLGHVGDKWYDLMGEEGKTYDKIRLKKKIHLDMVEYQEYPVDKKLVEESSLTRIRVLPQYLESPANMLIWDDYIALQALAEPYSVVQIKNSALATSYLNFFKLLWEQGRDLG